MQKFLSVSYSTSDQRIEAIPAIVERDLEDIKILLSFLSERNPFSYDPALHNIATGATAEEDKINAEDAKTVGTVIMKLVVCKCVFECSFKKKN